MATTSHLEITLLEQSQAQKEITINEAFARIDAVLNGGAIDRDLATPPASPAEGDVYIVAASPTGAWSGKAGKIAYYDQLWRFISPREGMVSWVNDEDLLVVYHSGSWQTVTTGGGGSSASSDFATVVEGRLTLTSGMAVTSSDVTAASTLYFTPHKGNRIALYNGSAWELKSFSEISLAVPATTATLYDVWAYNNSGTVALEATAWTNDTTRATALALQNGTYVKSGATTRRYLGSFRTTGVSGQTEDSKARRYVWNYYNRVTRLMKAFESAATWTYSTAGWRAANNNTANRLDFVRGVNEDAVTASVSVPVISSTATYRQTAIGIGEDTTTTIGSRYSQETSNNSGQHTLQSFYDEMPSAGRHFLSWNEYGGGTDTQTWSSGGWFGISGRMRG